MSCGICLQNKQNLYPIFTLDKEISFATMLTTVADVKIDSATNSSIVICLNCRKKLRELYDFKILIENSDIIQHQSYKKIVFNNIKDVELKIIKDEKIPSKCMKDIDISNMLNLHRQVEINYNDTIIKKVQQKTEYYKKHNPKSAYQHINFYRRGIKSQTEHTVKKTKSNINGNNTNPSTKKSTRTNVCIKPIYLDDFKLISAKCKKESSKKKLANKKYTRKDICPYCGKITGNIRNHVLLHTAERIFKCHKCNKSFYKESHLKSHVDKHILNPIFKCEHCVGAFSSKTSLSKHMAKHQDIRGYRCHICNKGFKWKSGLVRHTLIHNPNAKSFVCDICTMAFISKYGLRHHMRVHTGERPFMCEICLQPYSYKHDFNRHCFKKHGVFLKRRSVRIMNEEVLEREKAVMRDIALRVQGFKNGEFSNPFEGPQAAQAFEMAVKQLQLSGQMPVDYFL